jgi:ATP-binding cassette subfamily B protein
MLKLFTRSPRSDPDSAVAVIRRLISEHGAAHWREYALAFALMGVGAVCTALAAYLMGDMVNQAYIHRDFYALLTVSVIAMVVFAIRGASSYGHAVILSRIGNSIIAENQRRVFTSLLQQNLGFFADRHSSEFIARLSTGTTSSAYVLNLLVTSIGRDFLSLVGLLVVMVTQDAVMSLFTFVVAPIAIFALRGLVRRIRAIAMTQFTGGTRIYETLQETLQGMRSVKAFTLEETLKDRFSSNVAEVERESNKMARVGQSTSPLMETLGGLAIGLAIIYAGYRVAQGGVMPGGFFSFLTAFMLAYEPAKRLARLNLDLNAGLVGVRILFDIIDQPPSERADDDKPPLKLASARVEFRAVQFSYHPGEPVIRNLSFVAEPGKVTALVGPSGSGKSTILNLILRFYEIDSGAITIDGQDIAGVSRRSLRQQMAYVGQDVFLFRASVRDNIAFGHPGASDAEIVAAAKAAYAHDFIMGFPAGYDTIVGEHGTRLSGGERQRIAVARALIKNAAIILLDEATAALDSESEQQVQRAIEHLCAGRTTIVIAHRLPTVAHADQILVVEDGAVVETGRHEELLRQNGRYASFYRLQLLGGHLPEAAAAAASNA